VAEIQDDVDELLKALGMEIYARPYSTHELMIREVIPRAKEIYKILLDGTTIYDHPDALKVAILRRGSEDG